MAKINRPTITLDGVSSREQQAASLPAVEIKPGLNPRTGTTNQEQLDKRNAIADAHDAARAAELVEIPDTLTKDQREIMEGGGSDADKSARLTALRETKSETDKPTPDDTQVEAKDPATDPVVAEIVPETKTYKITVNGKEEELTEAEMVVRAQKVSSADEYLRAAKESVKIAATLGLPSKEDEAKSKDKDFRALARAIQMGSEDEAEQAIRQLYDAQPSKTPDVEKIVDTRLTLRDEKAKFDEEYKDVLADADARFLLIAADTALSNSNPDMPYQQRWRKAADMVRKSIAKTPSSLENKAARKAAVAPVPSAAETRGQATEAEPEDDAGSVIKQMAKARHQERPIQH